MNSIPQTNRQLNHQFPATLRIIACWDVVIITVLITACLFSIPFLHSITPETVVVYRENRIIATYPLSVDRTITVEGALGPVELQIKNRSVAITKSPCPQHVCERTGAIRNPSSQIICAPGHLLITITSSAKEKVDAIAR